MTWLWFVIASFATYYVALVVATQDGPFGVFDKLRMRWNEGYLGAGIRCPICVAAYAALVWTVLLGMLGLYDPLLWPVVWFGLAGAATFVDKVWKR